MKTFSYARARDAAEAVTGFTPGTMYLGGGTNLVDLMRLGVAAPDRLVDVSRLPLDGIGFAGETLHIGAAVRNSDLAAHPLVRTRYPMLAHAQPLPRNGYKVPLARNVIVRTLLELMP